MKKRIISILLSLMMIITSVCVPSFAQEDATADPYASLKDGTGLVSFGDSFVRGYGASDKWQKQLYKNDTYGTFNCRNVTGSYPNLIAEHFGLYSPKDIRNTDAKCWPIAHNNMSATYVLDLLGIDDGFVDYYTHDSESQNERYSTDLKYFGDLQSFGPDGVTRYGKLGEVMSIRYLVNNADIITLQVGQSDVLIQSLYIDSGDFDFNNMSGVGELIPKLTKEVEKNLKLWKKHMTMLMDYIKKNNPTAEVVLVGTMNPLQTVLLSDDIRIPIGSLINIVTDKMNNITEEIARKYGYIYADISNVDAPIYESKEEITINNIWNIDVGLAIHPSPKGYRQISKIICNAIEKNLAKKAAKKEHKCYKEDTPKTYIKVDTGRSEAEDGMKVESVKLDGKKIKKYSVDGSVVTIPHCTKLAKTLVISSRDTNDGKITKQTYSLSYKNGYKAKRIYITNDAEQTKDNNKAAIEKAVNGIKDAITGRDKAAE